MSSFTPVISVIIPAHNRRKMLLEVLESIFAQTYQPAEIVVVDDGSTDGSAEAVQALAPRVTLVRQANQGPSAARNRAFEQSSGEWIAIGDSDDLWEPERLQAQVDFLEAHPDVDFLFSDARVIRDDRLQHESFIWRHAESEYLGKHAANLSRAFEMLLVWNFVTTSTVLLRSALWRQVGSFDETLWSVEDRDFWLRAAHHGRLGYVDKVLVTKRESDERLGRDQVLRCRNLLQVLDRWRGIRTGVPPGLIDRVSHDTHYTLGSFLLGQKQYALSAQHLRQSIARYWANPKLYAKLAICGARSLLKA
ncbi:MAG: glycosyltransferase family 2 protein [Gammaproteobacteria bacterium]